MQRITKDKVSFIFFLFISSVMIISLVSTIRIQTYGSEYFPESNSLASDFVFEWNSSLGGVYVDGARGVAVDSNDNVYIAGYQDLSGSNTNRDMVIAKYNPQGALQWVRYWGGSNDDIPYDIVIDSSHNIFVVGLTKSFDDVDGDAVILKYNTTGHHQWNFTWGGSQFDAAISIDIDSGNNYYIGGSSHSFGDTDGDVFLTKFNSNWIEQWNETWGGSDTEEGVYVHIDRNDDIYTCGRSDSLDPSPAEGDAFLNKYNSSGNLLWSQSWGGSYTQGASGIATDSLNNVYIICMTFGHPASSGKGAIVKYNSEGTYQWEEIWGVNGVYANYMYRIIIDSNDDLYISGTTRSYGIPNNNDAILFNYDTNGNQNWYKIWSEYEWDLSFGLCMDSQSNIYLVGDTKSYTIGENDILLLKYAFIGNKPSINIITPENKTYTEPDSGYYPATYGFENDIDGTTPMGWNLTQVDATINVIGELDGHKKVVELDEGLTDEGYDGILYYSATPLKSGTFELYMRFNDLQNYVYLQTRDSDFEIGITVGLFTDYDWRYRLVGGVFPEIPNVNSPQVNFWHHIRVDFRFMGAQEYLGLTENRYVVTIDGISSGELAFNSGSSADLSRLRLGTGPSCSNVSVLFDGVGFSWDQNYKIGDNLNEGMFLSYENTNSLDWKGYSLDGQLNKKILGNTTIPMPNNGIHSIQVFGNDSIGASYSSNLRYFTVNVTPTQSQFINVVTPESKTYYQPMSGYYVASKGFEGVDLGQLPPNMDDNPSGANCRAEVISSKNQHNKVVHVDDDSSSTKARVRYNFTDQDYGTLEFWMYAEDASGTLALQWIDGTSEKFRFTIHHDKWEHYTGSSWVPIPNFDGIYDPQDNTWYHLTFHFRGSGSPTYQSLNENQYRVVIDGLDSGPLDFHASGASLDRLQFFTGDAPISDFWLDAFGESWDENYNIGDNLEEGLLLSFDNTTNLDWIGYSLNVQANRTILGNTTFPMPVDGFHKIQIFGSNFTGFIYESNVRYFTVNTASYPYIEIITPEARTYFEPMAGYHPATHGFENELGGTSGTAIEYVDVTTISSGCEVQIYDEYQGHKKVLRLHDGNAAGNARAQHDFSSTQTSGYVEWWWITPASGGSNMAFHFHEGSLGTHAGRVLMRDNYFEDMEGNIIQSYVPNQWYHHKIAFNTITDQYDWYIDGFLVVNDGNFENHVSNFGSTNIKGGWTSVGSCYIDAIGFSWEPDYSVGDNYKEGLLISYTNITNFDWIGYSVDGSSNITITGNMVIPLPKNGVHSIMLSGITSTGISIQSDVRYFTIDYQEPPSPPIPPIIPDPLDLIPIILNTMGFGIVALLGVTLILFIKHNKTQVRT